MIFLQLYSVQKKPVTHRKIHRTFRNLITSNTQLEFSNFFSLLAPASRSWAWKPQIQQATLLLIVQLILPADGRILIVTPAIVLHLFRYFHSDIFFIWLLSQLV